MNADAFDALRRRDEILQVMYWLRGERFGETASVADLRVFLGDEVSVLEADFMALAEAGLLEAAGPQGGRFRLTRRGMDEGGRRFADEFADFQRPGHGECNRPGCGCHLYGPSACVGLAGRTE
jgi:hypothetical protein